MEISIALTNLRKYNEGELVYTWLDLPATAEDIEEAFEKIGVADGAEWFISDNEAPFHIGEYESLSRLNEKAELLGSLDSAEEIMNGDYDAGDVINFANDLENEGHIEDAHEYVGDIVDDEQLDDMVYGIVTGEYAGWERVKCFLGGIELLNQDYYWINGYENAENLDDDHLDAIVSDLLTEIGLERE